MAAAKTKSKATRARKPVTPKRARGKLAPGAKARGLDAAEVVIAMDSAEIAEVAALIRKRRRRADRCVSRSVGRAAARLGVLP
jgi:hypothetical protein